MLSLSCKTAIKAVIFLASRSGQGAKAGMKEIAEWINASEHTVGKLLQTLVKEEVINSAKGPNGGFYITPKQHKQPLVNIIYAIDGEKVFEECGLGLSKCSATHPCPIHYEYKSVRDQFRMIAQQKRISDLSGKVDEGLAYLIG